MVSRRLESDRFFTTGFKPEVYTQTGIDWVTKTKMKDVLLRHYPQLEPALEGLPNAFLPGTRSGGRQRDGRFRHRVDGVQQALGAINS